MSLLQCLCKVRRQIVGIGSLLPPCGTRGSNSGHRAYGKCFYPLSHFTGPQRFKITFKSYVLAGHGPVILATEKQK